ncbi:MULTISPECIES: AAA family ATPase [Pantoea]|uniref:AAA family ATPase n=1 Tax=Pantoea TaxID=53335 RepID=UPI0004972BD8|nr:MULTISPECIES: AAA family ATPase [Pantoea]PWW16562.1 ATPase family protein associated with various cellular activities (AAA) [Pantoea sp. AG702]
MASANQIKLLVKNFIAKDERKFLSIVLQIAAHEARIGHAKLADELRTLVEKAKLVHSSENADTYPRVLSSSSAALNHSSNDLFTVSHPTVSLNEIIISKIVRNKLFRFLDENKNAKKIRQHGLSPRRHLLLYGPPGTGKTLTASVIAHELHLPLFTVRMDSLITKYMGETSVKLRGIFDYISHNRGVYLFDEFDSIGSKRTMDNDVGEIRRVLNTFLQLMDEHISDSLIISATNHKDILDSALYRRFDDVIEYELPQRENIETLIKNKFSTFKIQIKDFENIIDASNGLSYSEVAKSCDDAIKLAIINNKKIINQMELEEILNERKSYK